MQENAGQKQVAIQLRIKRQDALGSVEQRDDMLQQSAQVGVVITDASRRLTESLHEVVVHEKTLGQGAQMWVAQSEQAAPQPFQQLAHFMFGVRQEIGQLDFFGLDSVDMAKDHLQSALEE